MGVDVARRRCIGLELPTLGQEAEPAVEPGLDLGDGVRGREKIVDELTPDLNQHRDQSRGQ